MEITVEVVASIGSSCVPVGVLRQNQHRGKHTFLFEYAREWVDHPGRWALAPSLELTHGAPFPLGERIHPALADSMPDRWGCSLIQRRLQREGLGRTLTPMDYLLGVPDALRLGALRFRDPETGAFLHRGDPEDRPLEAFAMGDVFPAMEAFQREGSRFESIEALLGTGASLGGARPKIWVEEDGRQWLAKFPRANEGEPPDIMAREGVALAVARKAGVWVPAFRLEAFKGRRYALLTERFDRGQEGERIPFLSGQGLLDLGHREQASYPELLEAFEYYTGRDRAAHREELFRRALLNVLIGNTDDHLRNHGALLDQNSGQWDWSPVFDLEPRAIQPDEALSTALHWKGDYRASVDLAFESAEEFGLPPVRAEKVAEEVLEALSCWESLANRLNLEPRSINAMRSCFEHERVRELERRVASF